ncbi:DUF3775 domain-containing protein [Cytobacillus firmus]|uniref:DUF3775 domain-containing protein n=1 Tax=Cytobacillus firmus TaxID=1399 RepID=UPI002163E447|nr:DUF3775 domain-containing protein [Cytobacillus firmus]MCS0674626.1 DUF3775 domain-containing protein [Cytobacillus firmus]
MSNHFFDGKEQIFKDVIRLAGARKLALQQSGFDGGSIQEIYEFEKTPAGQRIQAAESQLDDYVSTLGYDDIMMLQTVMYLGRDRDYDRSQSSEEIYQEYLNYLKENGTNDKDIEANQMTEKGPLGDYLKSGLEILGVSI